MFVVPIRININPINKYFYINMYCFVMACMLKMIYSVGDLQGCKSQLYVECDHLLSPFAGKRALGNYSRGKNVIGHTPQGQRNRLF